MIMSNAMIIPNTNAITAIQPTIVDTIEKAKSSCEPS